MTHDSSDIGTIAHLPECWFSDPKKVPAVAVNDGWPCICDRLRACEQRVRMEDDDYAYVSAQAEADGRWRGWVEALDAAREAVAASWTGWCPDPTTCTDYEHVCGERRNVLAAIEALREEQK